MMYAAAQFPSRIGQRGQSTNRASAGAVEVVGGGASLMLSRYQEQPEWIGERKRDQNACDDASLSAHVRQGRRIPFTLSIGTFG